MPRRRQQTHKGAATKESQAPTEGIGPTQKQQIGSLAMLAEAAEAALLLRNSQRPGFQREPTLFDDDDFLRDFSPITDREQSIVPEIIPPLIIRTSPVKPKPNKFTNITREIVGNREVVATMEEDK
jgi:hypothetical protein